MLISKEQVQIKSRSQTDKDRRLMEQVWQLGKPKIGIVTKFKDFGSSDA
jgi:hypothetical protein